MEGSEDELDVVKKQFSNFSSAASSSHNGSAPTVSTLGKAPPTATFGDIASMRSIQAMPATVHSRVIVRDDYTPLRKSVADCLGPVKDLISSVRERNNAFKTRREAYTNDKSNKFGDLAAPSALPIFIRLSV